MSMLKKPQVFDFIYEEIRQCEEYALLNLLTFEASVRNPRVIEILNQLDGVSSEEQLDAMIDDDTDDIYVVLKKELKNEYFLDYETYTEYTRVKRAFLETYSDKKSLDPKYHMIVDKIQAEYEDDTAYQMPSVKEQVELYKKRHTYNVIVKHNKLASHTHHLSLPLHRPKMYIPQKESMIHIEVPMYHIHPKDIKAYYQRLMDKHHEVIAEAKEYYMYEELFYDEVNETKSKAETYALMFFVWDYVEWWKEQNGIFTPDKTARTVYPEIADSIGADVNDKTGRSPKVEKYLEEMNKLISKCGYKRFYIPKTS